VITSTITARCGRPKPRKVIDSFLSWGLTGPPFFGALPAHKLKNGGVREDPAIPARVLLPTDQGRPHDNCIGASIHWTGRARGDEPARTPQWHPGQYEALTKSEPRHQPSRPETRPNQRLYVPLGSPPLVAVGSSSTRAAHRSRAPRT
jgi:hypothetical protein